MNSGVTRNILLDRFPINTEKVVKTDLIKKGFHIPFSVITHTEVPDDSFTDEYLVDRDIAKGKFFSSTPWLLSQKDMDFFSEFEGLGIVLISRYSLEQKNFSAEEMSQHFFELINFWIFKLKEESINVCFSHTMPHEPSSFSLYLASKFLKIPYIFIDVPIIANKYRFLTCSLSNRMILLNIASKENNELILDDLKEYEQSIKNLTDSYIPLSLTYPKVNITNKIQNLLNKSIEVFKLDGFKKMLDYIFLKRIPLLSPFFFPFTFKKVSANTFFKVQRKSWAHELNDFNPFSYKLFLLKLRIKIFFKKRSYKKKALRNLDNLRFIYFASPAQPEATSLPIALNGRNVVLALKKLREVFPNDIKILYKENPMMFSTRNPYITGASWTNEDYYEEILKIKNLSLVDTDLDTFKLIDKSIGVASINGTISVEAIIRGKNAITFGNNWYDNLDGIFPEKKKNISDALYAMLNNEVPSYNFESLNFNSDLLVSFSKRIFIEFEEKSVKKLSTKFLNALEVFSSLSDEKWKV